MPSLALMYGWQSLPPNPSHLLTHTHTRNHTVQHTATHISRHRSVPQASPDSPPELLHVKLQQTDCCFLSITIFLLSIDNAINHRIHTALEGMCLSVATFCVWLCVCFEDGFIDRRCG